jgi:predicted PhzF superfamily epimerase YddE/YHI9
VLQGDDMGRPSRLTIELAPGRPEIAVTGRAVAIAAGNSP